jgi:hypothetical protein
MVKMAKMVKKNFLKLKLTKRSYRREKSGWTGKKERNWRDNHKTEGSVSVYIFSSFVNAVFDAIKTL